jgi:hypothetical protein
MVRAIQRTAVAASLVLSLWVPGSAWADAGASARVPPAALSRCDRVAQAVDARTASYATRAGDTAAALQNVGLRLANIIGRADARGYSIAKLQADQANLQHRTAAIAADYAAVQAAISSARNVCAAPHSRDTARAKLATLRADVQSLLTWQRTSLQADMNALKTARHL